MKHRRFVLAQTTLLALGCQFAAFAHAEPVAEFYKDQTITLYVAAGAGGSYGPYAQLTSKHLPRFIPGHGSMVTQYMPGAGGAKAANYLYAVAPRDGTSIGLLLKYIVINKVLGRPGLRYDPSKFTWLVSAGPINSVVQIWHEAPARTLEAARKTELIMGSTGKSSETYITPKLLNELVGTRFKIVTGYKGMTGMALAMEQGELHGRASSWDGVKSDKPGWIRGNKIVLIAQSGLEKNSDLPDVPRLVDLADNEEERRIFRFFGSGSTLGRIFVGPPGIPRERVAALRKAFDDMLEDPAFLEDAKKSKIVVEPKSWQEIEKLVHETVNVPEDTLQKAKDVLGL